MWYFRENSINIWSVKLYMFTMAWASFASLYQVLALNSVIITSRCAIPIILTRGAHPVGGVQMRNGNNAITADHYCWSSVWNLFHHRQIGCLRQWDKFRDWTQPLWSVVMASSPFAPVAVWAAKRWIWQPCSSWMSNSLLKLSVSSQMMPLVMVQSFTDQKFTLFFRRYRICVISRNLT